MIDEFEIKARASDGSERVWTRRTLEVSKSIADNAVQKLGFIYARVINTHGGDRSKPLYIVVDKPNERRVSSSKKSIGKSDSSILSSNELPRPSSSNRGASSRTKRQSGTTRR